MAAFCFHVITFAQPPSLTSPGADANLSFFFLISKSIPGRHPRPFVVHATVSGAGGWLKADIPKSLICKLHHTGASARLSTRDSPA